MRFTRNRLVFLVVTAAALLAAAVAEATVTYVVTSHASINKAGSKAHPARFNAGFTYAVSDSTGARIPTPSTYISSWSGVKMNGTGFPVCTAQKIAAAQSDAGCPKGSLVALAPFTAELGPESNPHSNVTCDGKVARVYNGGGNRLAFFAVGPPAQCAGVSYIPPFVATISTSGNTSTLRVPLPQTISHPLPGITGGLTSLDVTFKPLSVKRRGKTYYYMTSTACRGQRKFTFAVTDTAGRHIKATNAGKCTR